MNFRVHEHVVLVLAVMVTLVASDFDVYEDCMEEQTGQEAFQNAYENLCYQNLSKIQNPTEWCQANYKHEYSECENDLAEEGINPKSLLVLKNIKTSEYYNYLWNAYKPYISKKNIKSPTIFCTKYANRKLVNDYDGNPIDLNVQYEDDNNDQDQVRYAGKGLNSKYNPDSGHRGYLIDLNVQYEDDDHNQNQIQYAGEELSSVHNPDSIRKGYLIDLNVQYEDDDNDQN